MYRYMSPWVEWKKNQSCWKVWVDGSYNAREGQAALAAVVRNPQGRLVARKISLKKSYSSTHAELLAVWLGVQTLRELAGAKGMEADWILYCDCRSLPRSIGGQGHDHKVDRELLDNILANQGGMKTQWIPRRENRDADQCAQRAHSLRLNDSSLLPRSTPTARELDRREKRNQLLRAERRLKQRQHIEWKRWRTQQTG